MKWKIAEPVMALVASAIVVVLAGLTFIALRMTYIAAEERFGPQVIGWTIGITAAWLVLAFILWMSEVFND